MRWREIVRQALRNIQAYPLRVSLVVLTLAIAAFSLAAVNIFVSSLRQTLLQTLLQLGPLTLIIHKWPFEFVGDNWYKYERRPPIRYSEYVYLSQQLPDLRIAYTCNLRQKVYSRYAAADEVILMGLEGDFWRAYGLKIAQGQFFTPAQARGGQAVAVLGANLARELFPNRNPIGEKLYLLGGYPVEILGVLKKQGNPLGLGQGFDERVFIPYTLLEKVYSQNMPRSERFITLQAAALDQIATTEMQIRLLMRQMRRLPPKEEDSFSINRQTAILKRMDNFFLQVRLGGWVIAFFAILVGSIGVTNVLYVSVRERMPEIGIQRALGATQSFIRNLFLTEAFFLCLLGTFGGVVFAVGLGYATRNWLYEVAGMTLSFPWTNLLYTTLFMAAVGIIAGWAPARHAAHLDPIEAMRSG
ncbi:MAG: ABC transporter permease [Bacteroidia bacterium]